jgi:hypothetical protein
VKIILCSSCLKRLKKDEKELAKILEEEKIKPVKSSVEINS